MASGVSRRAATLTAKSRPRNEVSENVVPTHLGDYYTTLCNNCQGLLKSPPRKRGCELALRTNKALKFYPNSTPCRAIFAKFIHDDNKQNSKLNFFVK